MDKLDTTFAALADPTRRAIIERLSHGPASVHGLTEPFALSQQMISKHIACLVRARIVIKTKRGRKSISHPNTKEGYKYSVAHLLEFFGENTKLSDISVARIEKFKQSRLASGVKPATVNRNLSVLRRMLTLATRQRFLARNPVTEVEFLEALKYRRRPHILTWQEQDKILAVAAPHLRVLVVLLTETGLRVNKEALALKWEDIDFHSSQLFVHDSKTIAGRRTVPLSELCKSELLRWEKLVGAEYSPYVFPNLDRPGNHILCVRKTWSTALRATRCD